MTDLIKDSIKTIADYPKAGIQFRDVTSLMQNAEAFSQVIETFAARYKSENITAIVGTEARGFIFGAPLAYKMNLPFVPVRKPGKLPRDVYSQPYQLEYGEDILEIHADALSESDNVLMVDDLLATGGTIEATSILIKRIGAQVSHACFVVDLPDLGGRARLEAMDLSCFALTEFEGE